MNITSLGYHKELEQHRQTHQLEHFDVGRVVQEHKERYIVRTDQQEAEAEIIGNLRFTAESRADFPAVGDWVATSSYDEDKMLIHAVFPRKTSLERQAVNKSGEKQLIATNIDYAFIVQAAGHDFNLNRIERYLTICNTSNITPVVILNKIDLLDHHEVETLVSQIQKRIHQVPVLAISNETQQGIDELKQFISSGKTYCLLGSSGVGKSTLINVLSGRKQMKTNTISTSTNKGRHSTTHRELIVLENGGILIDTPGMREIGITDNEVGLVQTFETIYEIAQQCKFKDCTHTNERGCAILTALEEGLIDEKSYENYVKLEREKMHYESTVLERRRKDKAFGKMVKQVKKIKNKTKY